MAEGGRRVKTIGIVRDVEVQNNTEKPVVVSVCRSKSSSRLYIHIGGTHDHGNNVTVKGFDCAPVEVTQVRM